MISDEWDFYFCTVDNKIASIFVDMGALNIAPLTTHPEMAYISLTMRASREDGLSSQEEYDDLRALETVLEAVGAGPDAFYVGRCTSDGRRDFYFYTGDGDSWQARVDSCMQAFPDYQFKAGHRPEPDWSTYCSYLYPSDAAMQSIQNRRLCTVMQENGDPLCVARDIDHWAYFTSAAARETFLLDAGRLGFSVRTLYSPDDAGKFGARVWRSDVPGMNTIDDITRPLYELALEHGGNYDGWETSLEKSGDAVQASTRPAATLGAKFVKACRNLFGSR
jgi:hypothetical protein